MEQERKQILSDELQSTEPSEIFALPAPFSFDKLPLELPAYKGSAELLLWLLRRQFVEVGDVVAKDIACQAQTRLQNPVQKADALALAAELTWLKSALLLPQPEPEVFDVPEEETQDGDQLRKKLIRNATYGLVAKFLAERSKVWSQMFPRPASDETNAPLKQLVLSDEPIALLTEALRRVLARMAGSKVKIPRRRLTVPQRIRMLLQILKSMPEKMATFDALCSDCESLLEVIVTFLAVLELVRRGLAGARQDEPFGPIFVFLK
ncbi:MAG: segregation/condensation protein A [Armatimonadetes bacterium]|nr:segregation/condensation protein A [Armatimonadota bacterium]MDW8029713.1 segregation/condensation protein A [Armatimonadota bacterium]